MVTSLSELEKQWEKEGYEAVYRKLHVKKVFAGEKERSAKNWLRKQEEINNENEKEEQRKLIRESNGIARDSNRIAWVALGISIVALVLEFCFK